MTESQKVENSTAESSKGRRKRIFQLLFVLAVLPFVLYGCVLFGSFAGTSGRHASAWRANLFLSSGRELPKAARDVYYYTDWAADEAEFSISEDGFLNWCKSNGWEPEPIEEPIEYFYPTWGPEEDNRLVKRGYYGSAAWGVLIFDADRSRAAIRVSDFP